MIFLRCKNRKFNHKEKISSNHTLQQKQGRKNPGGDRYFTAPAGEKLQRHIRLHDGNNSIGNRGDMGMMIRGRKTGVGQG